MTFLRNRKHYLPSDLLVVFILPPAPPAENSFASLERGSGTKKCSLARDSRKTEARQSEEGIDEPIDQPIRIVNPTSKQSARPTKKRTLPKDENASGTGVVEKRAKTEITHVKMVGGHWRRKGTKGYQDYLDLASVGQAPVEDSKQEAFSISGRSVDTPISKTEEEQLEGKDRWVKEFVDHLEKLIGDEVTVSIQITRVRELIEQWARISLGERATRVMTNPGGHRARIGFHATS